MDFLQNFTLSSEIHPCGWIVKPRGVVCDASKQSGEWLARRVCPVSQRPHRSYRMEVYNCRLQLAPRVQPAIHCLLVRKQRPLLPNAVVVSRRSVKASTTARLDRVSTTDNTQAIGPHPVLSFAFREKRRIPDSQLASV